jgi:hypothetical protein
MRNKQDNRFEVVYEQGGLTELRVSVLRDKETGVHYLLTMGTGMGASGITPLLDVDGNIKISK